jgi:protein-disulfide isomerase
MDKRFWAIIGVIALVFFGILFFRGEKDGTDSSSKAASGQPTNHVKGPADAKVTLLEYGDFQCPACASFEPVVKTVQEKYAETMKFQFRNLPLTQIHTNAFAAARAAEAADLQGKYWEMHDALYLSTNWSQWTQASDPKPLFWQYAEQLGLNVAKYKTDFAGSTVNSRINADIAAFNKTGQPMSTPSFFINGEPIANSELLDAQNQPSVEAFSRLIDQALAKQ